MNRGGELRKQIATKIKQNLDPYPKSALNLIEIEEFFIRRKPNFQKNASPPNQDLASKINGTNYRCVFDEEQFQHSNNIKALMLAIFQILFQDQYIASLLISEINQNHPLASKIQDFPLEAICQSSDYSQIIQHAIFQLCDICQENQDIPIRNILSAYYLGFEMMALIFRCILMKLKYPAAEKYQNKDALSNTPQIYAIICEYLDINMIAKNATSKNSLDEKSGQVYLFTDYDIFISTYDNQQFICGVFSQNQVQIEHISVNNSQISIFLGKSRRIQEDEIRKSTNRSSLKNSECCLDLGVSGSEFMFASRQQQGPFFSNSNAPTPQFGFQGSQSLKFRKNLDRDQELITSFSPIKEEPEKRDVNPKQNQYQFTRQKNSTSFIASNIASIIIDRQQQELIMTNKDSNLCIEEMKPVPLPQLAGIAQIRYTKKKTQTEEEIQDTIDFQKKNCQKKESDENQHILFSVAGPMSIFSDFNSEQVQYQDMQIGSPKITPRNLFNYISSPSSCQEFPALKQKTYKGSYNQPTNLTKIQSEKASRKQSYKIPTQDKELKSFETFSKKSKLNDVLEQIKRRNKQKSDEEQISQKDLKEAGKKFSTQNQNLSIDSKLKSNRSFSERSNLSKRTKKNQIASNVVNIALNAEPLKIKKYQVGKHQRQDQKMRKFSENKSVTSFQFTGSRSQNLIINRNFVNMPDREDFFETKLVEIKEKQQLINLQKITQLKIFKAKSEQSLTHKLQTKRSLNKANNSKSKALNLIPKNSKNTYRKFPEFLRNNRQQIKDKKFQGVISNGKKDLLKQSKKLLKTQQSHPKFQVSGVPLTKKNLKDGKNLEKRLHNKQLSQIEEQNILKKSKTTQSYPTLLEQKFLHRSPKNMVSSVMPESIDICIENRADSSFTSLQKNPIKYQHPNQSHEFTGKHFVSYPKKQSDLHSSSIKGIFTPNLSTNAQFSTPLRQYRSYVGPCYKSTEHIPSINQIIEPQHKIFVRQREIAYQSRHNQYQPSRRGADMNYFRKDEIFGTRRF